MLTKLDIIQSGLQAVQSKTEPDRKDFAEEDDAAAQQAAYLTEQINDIQSNRVLRGSYAIKVFRYLVGYSIACLVIILLQGFSWTGFKIETIPLTTLVGSTAVAAIGLVGFVVQGLFKNAPSSNKTKKRRGNRSKKPRLR